MNFIKKATLAASISLFLVHGALATQFADTLDPSDKHNPRETMESFLENVNLSYRYIMEANNITAQSSSFLFHPPQALSKARKANIYLNRAVQCLDMREIPEVYRDEIGRERALMLKEILDRVPVPEPEDIPGTKEMASKPIPRWRIPGTEIRLERVSSGEQEGYFLFSAATVDKIPFFYSLVKSMPYKNEFTTTQGFFDWYNDTPGHLFPPRWSLFLPKWSMITLGDNTLWQWFSLIGIVFLTVYLIALAMGFFKNKKTNREPGIRQGVLRLSFTTVSIAIALTSRYLLDDVVNLTGEAMLLSTGFLTAFIWVLGSWIVFQISYLMAEMIILSPRVTPNSIDASMLRTSSQLLGIMLSLAFLMYGASQLGIPLASVITGLGVAGLAISLAAKPTVENVIGGITLFADKPVQVGDFCQFGNNTGTVIEIGIRSTKLRTIDRTVLSVPNAEFSQLQLKNLSRRDKHLFEATIGLRYETSMDQLRWILTEIKEMLLAHPKVHHSPPVRVRFTGFGDYSLNVATRAFIQTKEWEEFLAIKEDLLLRISEIVEESGSGFAFPSTTAYLSDDTPPDREIREKVEAEVQAWRDSGALPFPNVTEERAGELKNTLDYPPKGSPGA
nr:mechanosensitive ion channel family protein [uncultured Dethiosulfovibrio sp.]